MNVLQSKLPPWWPVACTGLLLAIGIGCRVGTFVINGTLWGDEVSLADNIISRSPAELLEPLDNNQVAPIGFLLMAKGAQAVFGNGDRAFRLVPLLFSIAALLLIYLAARKCLGYRWSLAVLALAALNPKLIRYAAEGKQYSMDLAVAATIVYLCLSLMDCPTRASLILAFVVGVVAPWLSYESVFVLVGGAIALVIWQYRRRSYLLPMVIVAVSWMVSFAANYVLLGHQSSLNRYLQDYWAFAFLPTPTSPWGLRVLGRTLLHVFEHPLGLTEAALGAFAFILGVVILAKRDPPRAILLVGPLLLALVASMIRVYPFFERLLMFAFAGTAIVIMLGVRSLHERSSWRLVAPTLLAMMLAGPAWNSLSGLRRPMLMKWDLGPVMQTLAQRWRQGDAALATPSAAARLEYYRRNSNLMSREVSIVEGQPGMDWWSYHETIARLKTRHRRVWLIYDDPEGVLRTWSPGDGLGPLVLKRGNTMGPKTVLYDFSPVDER